MPDGWNPKYWYDMRTYLSELSDEDKLRSRDSQTSYTEGFSEELHMRIAAPTGQLHTYEFKDQDFF